MTEKTKNKIIKPITAVLVVIIALTAAAVNMPAKALDKILSKDAKNVLGIDVSKWQGSIDWNKVKSSGIDFAIIRVGYSGAIDPCFESNYAGAKSAGIDVGVYMYTYADTLNEAIDDAYCCINWLRGKQLEYPVYFDIEDKNQSSLSVSFNTDLALTFLEIIKDNGFLPALYSSASWLDGSGAKIDTAQVMSMGYDVWIARYYDYTYNDNFGYAQKYGMWQYSSLGIIDGINGYVDLNICYKDYPSIVRQNGYNGYPDPNAVIDSTDSDIKSTDSDIKQSDSDTKQSDTDTSTEHIDTVTDSDNIETDTENPSDSEFPAPKGDINGDGKVTMDDVVLLQRQIAKLVEFTSGQIEVADVDNSGGITMTDVTTMQKFIAKLIDKFE